MNYKKHLVISAVNIVEAGTLAVLRSCLDEAEKLSDWQVTAIVHSKSLFENRGITFIELPDIKRSWIKRLKFEYYDCSKISRELMPDFWLSMHDTTPNLGRSARVINQAVYCHNAMCFYNLTLREIFLEPKLLVFSLLYGTLYKIFLKRNKTVIVQQEWIKSRFQNDFGFDGNIIVASPVKPVNLRQVRYVSGSRFLYVSYPRVFKNFEVLLEAWSILESDPDFKAELVVTLDRDQNRYSKLLYEKYKHLRSVSFVGTVEFAQIKKLYQNSHCLIFPSRLETWGMPLSEAMEFGLSILAADLPYAKETLAGYDGVTYFDPSDSVSLARNIKNFIAGHNLPSLVDRQNLTLGAVSWKNLFEKLLND